MIPPKPRARADKVSLWRYMQLFRRDILSAQPQRLYRAKMAAFRTPFFSSFLLNTPELVSEVLEQRARDFPKSDRIASGLSPLLGAQSVFLTNGETWEGQRRLIDPAFAGGRVRDQFDAMRAAIEAAVARWPEGEVEIEGVASHLAADIIFRTLFSLPIEEKVAQETYQAFRAYQQSAPILNMAALVPFLPRLHSSQTRKAAARIRRLIGELVSERRAALTAGQAPDDLASRILLARDPETGAGFDDAEMVDQVAIFFLAGHETSAAALGWALYLLATHPEWQEQVAAEAAAWGAHPDFADLARLKVTRNVFRETLRLYPPVPMMVREARIDERFRDRDVPKGAQLVISPWHLHRHEDQWERPDHFDPGRFDRDDSRQAKRNAYLPFSKGPRVCPGASFAMIEGVLALTMLMRAFQFTPVPGRVPEPVARLTVRASDGIYLHVTRRAPPL